MAYAERFSCTSAGDLKQLGSALTFQIDPESSSHRFTITYECGYEFGTIVTKTSLTKVTWTPPLSLAEQAPNSTSVPATYRLEVYIGDERVDSQKLWESLKIPDSLIPTVSVEVYDLDGHMETYGGYIQGRSALNVMLTSEGVYGSSIVGENIDVDGKVFSGSNVTTDVLKSYGAVELKATVTDSRFRTNTATKTLTVLEYSPPVVTELNITRCTQAAKPDPNGNYLMVTYSASVSPLGNKNSASYTLKYKKTSESEYTTKELSGSYVVDGASTVFLADLNSTYDIALTVADNFTETTKTNIGQSKKKLWSILSKGVGFAFGKIAELENALDMGWRIHMNGSKITGLGSPEDDTDAANKAYVDDLKSYVNTRISEIYSIGAIYLSTSSTSPASLFGGTWERIQDVFLLAAGEYFTAGETGGEYEHKLTSDEMPRHRHYGVRRNAAGDYGTHSTGESSGSGDTNPYSDYAGGDAPHNNMPPYLTVYMWKRIA